MRKLSFPEAHNNIRKLAVFFVVFALLATVLSLPRVSGYSTSTISPQALTSTSSFSNLTSPVYPNPVRLPTIGSIPLSSDPSYYAGAYTGLLSSQEALTAQIYNSPCSCSSGDILASWIAYPVVLKNGTDFWSQMGWYDEYGDTQATCFAQIWNLNTLHELWTGSCGGESFYTALHYKITVYFNSYDFYFGNGNTVLLTWSTNVEITGPCSSCTQTPGPNQAFTELQPVNWKLEDTIQFITMSSYLSGSWSNWCWGKSYGTAQLVQGNSQNNGIPLDQFDVGTGVYVNAGNYLWHC